MSQRRIVRVASFTLLGLFLAIALIGLFSERLLREEISRKPLREQRVAAYLIGGPLTVAGLAAQVPDLPICASPTQSACVVAWNARGPGYQPGTPPRDFMSRLLDRALGPENYHPIEYQIFFVNLRHNAQARLTAFAAR